MPDIVPPARTEVEAAAEALRDVVVRTPLVPLPGVHNVWFKPEIHQPGGSFKIRGVYHAVQSMDQDVRRRGISTVSAGNTAKALAWAGRRFGIPARSIMPRGAPRTKIDAVRALGGEPVLVPTEEVFAYLRERRWESEPYGFVHPWIDREVMIGHGTMALEILDDLPDVDTVYVPVGGGGLMGGVGGTLKTSRPDVRVIAVEPAGCPSLHAALAAGRPVEVPCDTICDGVAVPYVTDEMFPVLRDIVDDVVLVEESAVRAAIRLLATSAHVVAEASGALALAAALAADPEGQGRAVAIVTGGSIDADRLVDILIE